MPITSYPGWVDKLRQGDSLRGTIDAYSTVPMLYRAVNLRCDAISTVPYTLFRGDEEAEWPFRQDLAQLIKDTERHLLLTGGAFWLKLRRGRVLTGFQLLNPLSMTVTFDARKAEPGNPYAGITFHQKVGETNYGPWSIEDIVYFREPSMQDEVRPGLAPAYVALESSRLAHYLERFVSHFFEGGAQPITVLNLPESMDESEFKRFQTEWTARFTGVINAFRTAFVRAPDLKVTTITPDINTLMLPELQERVITSIGMTLGVPRTMLEASAANYATADSDRQSFWRETIVPRLSLYTQVLNNQLLEGLGYEIVFQPEALDVLQADEANRAGSLLQLVQAGVPLRGAMTILGYDGIEDALGPEPAPIGVASPEPTPPEPSPAPPTDDVVADAQTTEQAVASLRAEHWELLAKKLERRIKAGKSAVCGFESDAISQDEVKSVMARITPQMTVHEARHIVDEVKAVDDMTDDERRIYDKLVGEFRKRGEAWVRKILRNENVDPTLSDIVAPVLNAELSRVAQAQIDTIGNDIGVPATDAAQDRVVDWLVDYVPMETRLIDATTAERIKKVIDAYRQTSGMTSQDVADMIRPSVDPARALMIARTETVRAQTQANVIYQGYLRERGLNYERTWITENDELVSKCPICFPLHNTPESTWPSDVAGGPPGHPNCRCSTALRLVKP